MLNAGYHVNCGAHVKGVYTITSCRTSSRDMAYDIGRSALGRCLGPRQRGAGSGPGRRWKFGSRRDARPCAPECRPAFRAVSVAAWCACTTWTRAVVGCFAREATRNRMRRACSRAAPVAPFNDWLTEDSISDQPRVLPTCRPASGILAQVTSVLHPMLPEYAHPATRGRQHDKSCCRLLAGSVHKPAVPDVFREFRTGR